MKAKFIFIFLCAASLLTSCTEYTKLTKSHDVDLKFTKAKEYYEKGKYLESATLLESCVTPLRGTEKGEEALYLMAASHFKNKDYMTARSYYSGYCKSYPRGRYAEDARFHIGLCYYEESPEARLDQENTNKGIDEFTTFIAMYPRSSYVAEAQSKKQELRDKLAYKAYLNAKLYYRLGNYQGNNYKSCIIAATNALKEYPESIYREEMSYLILLAKYHQALESVESKQEDRFRETVEEYHTFIQEYPESEHKDEAEDIFKYSEKKINRNH